MAGFGNTIPKPEGQRRRRNAPMANTVKLPAEGRDGPLPTWPLSRPTKRELAIWERLWATPQSVAWERLGWADVVARYARQLTVAEQRNAPITALAEARQLEDRLGLSPLAMLRLRWEIVADEVAEQRADRTTGETEDLRAILRAVE